MLSKDDLRILYRKKRKQITSHQANIAANSLLEQLLENLSLPVQTTIAGYLPRDCEINPIPSMRYLHSLGHLIVIPIISTKTLVFQEWLPSNTTKDNFLTPYVLLIPLIAFDRDCYRLGFGKGWYDRTIEALRVVKSKFIGVAYQVQLTEQMIVEEHDEQLDMVITEQQVFRSK